MGKIVVTCFALTLFAFGCGHAQKPQLAPPPETTLAPVAPQIAPAYNPAAHWRALEPSEYAMPTGAIAVMKHESGAATAVFSVPFLSQDGMRPIDLAKDSANFLTADGSMTMMLPPYEINGGQTAVFGLMPTDSGDNAVIVRYYAIHDLGLISSGPYLGMTGFAAANLDESILNEMLELLYRFSNNPPKK